MAANKANNGDSAEKDTILPATKPVERKADEPDNQAAGPASDEIRDEPRKAGSIGPYEILGEIGRGGMGVVYKAFHPGQNRTVALKVLTAGEDATEDAIRRFQREARAVMKLGSHPNIVPVYETGQEGRLHYFAMQLVAGKSLDQLIDEGALTPRRAAAVSARIALALQHAHDHGILHRDVKPANILMDDALEPHVVDFGLAKDVQSGSKLTASGSALGTPQYMPPEQADGRLKDIGARSDVYSLGATLYEMLTLDPPFQGETMINVIKQVLLDEPVHPRKKNRLVDRDLETICLKCLEKDPARRYESAAALAADLGNYVDGKTISARPPSFRYLAVKKIGKHKALSVTAVASLALLIAGGIAAAILVTGKEREREKESQRAREKESEAAEERTQALQALGDLEKGRRVSGLLRAAEAELGKAFEELKRSAWSAAPIEERRNVYEKWAPRIDAFGREAEKDPSTRAAWLALKGWFLREGGFEDEAFERFQEARSADSTLAYGSLFEAMLWLSRYLSGQPMPDFSMSASGVRFDPMPGETGEMELARKNFEKRIAEAASARLWGDTASDSFAAVLAGFRAMQEEKWEEAESGLSRALHIPELLWMASEIRLARAKVRYLRQRFAESLEDIDSFLAEHPDSPDGFRFKGQMNQAEGILRHSKGEDPREPLKVAIEAFSQVITWAPEDAAAHNGRAVSLWILAGWEETRDIDPRETYRRAIAGFSEALRRAPALKLALNNRGAAYNGLAKAEAMRGVDPRQNYRKAIQDFDEAIGVAGQYSSALINRANAYIGLGEAEEARGEDPRENYKSALDDLREALKSDPESADAFENLGNTLARLGMAEAARGFDPRQTLNKALESYEAALRLNPGKHTLFSNRASVRTSIATAEFIRGGDPRKNLLLSIEDCAEALKRNPENHEAYQNRGNAHRLLGDAQIKAREDPLESYRLAIADFDEALRRNPGYAPAHQGRGSAYLNAGQAKASRGEDPLESYREAISSLDEAIAKNPRLVEAYVSRGIAYSCLGEAQAQRGIDPEASFAEGLASFDEAVERNPGLWQVYANRGMLLQILGRYSEAAGSLEKAIEIVRDAVPALKQKLARLKGLASGPEWGRAMELGESRMKSGWFSGALDSYSRAVEGLKKSEAPDRVAQLARAHYLLACCNAQLSAGKKGKLAAAVEIEGAEKAAFQASALDNIRALLELGKDDSDRLRREPLLEPVRSRPEFEEALKGR